MKLRKLTVSIFAITIILAIACVNRPQSSNSYRQEVQKSESSDSLRQTVQKSESSDSQPQVVQEAGASSTSEEPTETDSKNKNVDERVFSGSIVPIKISNEKKYAKNIGFKGSAFIIFDQERKQNRTDLEKELLKLIYLLGGDGFHVNGAFCRSESNELFLGNVLKFGENATFYSNDFRSNCAEKLLSIGPDFASIDDMLEQSHFSNVSHKYLSKKKAHRLIFENSKVEIANVKSHCMCSDKYKVTVYEKSGGKLVFNEIFTPGIIIYDVDQNGEDEIYLVSSLACTRYLKIFQVIPKIN